MFRPRVGGPQPHFFLEGPPPQPLTPCQELTALPTSIHGPQSISGLPLRFGQTPYVAPGPPPGTVTIQLQGPPRTMPSDQGGRQEPPAIRHPVQSRPGGRWAIPPPCPSSSPSPPASPPGLPSPRSPHCFLSYLPPVGGGGGAHHLHGGVSALGAWPMQARMAQARERGAASSHHRGRLGGGSLGTGGSGWRLLQGKPDPPGPTRPCSDGHHTPAGPHVPRSLRLIPSSAEGDRAHSASGSTTLFIPGPCPPSRRGLAGAARRQRPPDHSGQPVGQRAVQTLVEVDVLLLRADRSGASPRGLKP